MSSSVPPGVVGSAATTGEHAAELTIDRLFDAPALAGPAIVGLQIAADGSRVIYLQGKPESKDRLDLWEYNLHDEQARLLVDSRVLEPTDAALSNEEQSRRERRRTAALSGIVEYSFAPPGNALLFLLGGEVYHYDPALPANEALRKITHGEGFATEAGVSPRGGYVAYIRDQNLYCLDFATHLERALTRDGGGPVSNGTAEFVAQEEMGRSSGYWWSPDDSHVAFVRVDETPIKVLQRVEIAADDITTIAQRYPVTGGANALIRLGIADVRTGSTTWVDLGSEVDVYLARVNWLPDGKTLAVQRESRDQRRLDLLFSDTGSGMSRVVLTETSSTWIELNDELTFLKNAPEFIWASARDGFTHLYLYGTDGRLIRRLTEGGWNVDDFRDRAIKGVDETRRVVYFMATEKSPLERHLYSVSLDPANPAGVRRISQEDGVHRIAMSADTRFYVDIFTNISLPPRVTLHSPDGSQTSCLLENRLDHRHPDAPYLPDNTTAEFGELTAADGQVLHYQLFRPRHFDPAKRHPAIVNVYGGPGAQRVVNQWGGSAFNQILTRAGYVVFELDNRGSASRGTAFQAPIHGRLGQIEVADQVRGARWLAAQGFVDPERIGVWGWSYGGYITLMLMFKAPEIFHAGVAGAPVTDWTLYDTHYTERFLGNPKENTEGYEVSSVLPYAKNLRGRLLVIHGMADDNVLFLHSAKLFRRLQDLGKSFDVMVYPGAKHGLLRQHDGRHAYGTVLRFFHEHLR